MIDREIGPFWVLEQIAQGESGSLYKGVHKTKEQEVLIREIAPLSFPDAAARKRFLRDAAFLRHAAPSRIVRIHYCAEENETVHLVTDRFPTTLEKRLQTEGSLPVSTAIGVCLTILEALQFLHRYHMVHGHISPDSVVFAADGEVRLGYFGACALGSRDDAPFCCYPEEERQKTATAASDIYAVAALLCLMIGAYSPAPFAAATSQAVPRDEEKGLLTPSLRKILTRAMATDPAVRFRSPAGFATALLKVDQDVGASASQLVAGLLRFRGRGLALGVLIALLLVPLIYALTGHRLVHTKKVETAPRPVGTELPPARGPLTPPLTMSPTVIPPVPKDRPEGAKVTEPAEHKKKTHPKHHRKKSHRYRWVRRETVSLPARPVPVREETASPPAQPGGALMPAEIESWSIRK